MLEAKFDKHPSKINCQPLNLFLFVAYTLVGTSLHLVTRHTDLSKEWKCNLSMPKKKYEKPNGEELESQKFSYVFQGIRQAAT